MGNVVSWVVRDPEHFLCKLNSQSKRSGTTFFGNQFIQKQVDHNNVSSTIQAHRPLTGFLMSHPTGDSTNCQFTLSNRSWCRITLTKTILKKVVIKSNRTASDKSVKQRLNLGKKWAPPRLKSRDLVERVQKTNLIPADHLWVICLTPQVKRLLAKGDSLNCSKF